MRTTHSKFLQALLLILAVVFAMPSQAQKLTEGWYQIKRSMSATEIEKQLKDVNISKIGEFFKNAVRQEYLYVGDEIAAEQKFLGFSYGQKTYGAKYIESTAAAPINTGDVNTYFYIIPVEGETEAYTVRSYNGHYLHSDGTFCVEPETLYLDNALDIKAEATKTGWAPDAIAAKALATGINTAIKLMNISGYSVGKPTTSYEFDPSKIAGAVEGFVDPGFKITTSYKEMSWQQSVTEKTTEETDADGNVTTKTELVYGEYMDGKKADVINLGTTLAKDLLSGELVATDAMSIIRFIMRNFCSDAYTFHKVNLTSVNGGGTGILGSIAGVAQQKELIPYTVQIEGWDGTFTVNPAKDYVSGKQVTHTNAAAIIQSDATMQKYESAPIYNGGTIFGVKSKKLFGEGEESSFIDKGEHGCSNVVLLVDENYSGGVFGLGANGVQDFRGCISAACIDEENNIIHVYVTKPGSTWKVNVAQNKFVTRHAPFALNIAASETESSGFMGMTKKTYTSEAYYATDVDGEEVELVKLDGVIPAHTAVVIKNTSKESGSHEFKYKVASKEDQALEAPEDNLLHGVCFAYTLDNDVNAYVLKTVNGNQKFYKLNQEDRALAPWRAYLEWNGAANSPLRMAGFDEEIEGIDTVIAPESSNAAIYDLSGRRVNSSNGVTISAGKKFINK